MTAEGVREPPPTHAPAAAGLGPGRVPPSPRPRSTSSVWLEVLALAVSGHIQGAARSMRECALLKELPDLAVPSMVICGDRDRHVPLHHHLTTQQAIRRCGLQVYFDVGHVPFQETPDHFASDLLRFVDTLN